MPARSLEIGPAGMRTARTIEILRTERGLSQRQLARRVTALGHPMSNTMLSRIERVQRRCDIDDLVALAEALHVAPPVLLGDPSSSDLPPELDSQSGDRR